jgi:hypothetical protein
VAAVLPLTLPDGLRARPLQAGDAERWAALRHAVEEVTYFRPAGA